MHPCFSNLQICILSSKVNFIIKTPQKLDFFSLTFGVQFRIATVFSFFLLKALIDLTNGGKEPNKSVMSANCKDFEIIIINMLTL